jgi:hypothetical protein
MKKLSIAVLLVSVLFVTTDAFAEEDSNFQNVIIHMKVTNATAKGGTTVGDSAFITLYDNNKEVETIESLIDDSGMAVFEYSLGDRYLLLLPRVRHQVMMYSGPTIHLHASPDPIQVQVEVYDVSKDNSGLTVGAHHLIIKQVAGNILIEEYMQLKNDTDKAITTDKTDDQNRPQIITIFLPTGFQQFNISKYFVKDALVMAEDSFYDTMAIPPGTYDAMFSYTLPITGEEMQISKKISLPVGDVMVFSQLQAGQLTGLGIPAGNLTMEDGSPAEYFMLSKKSAGDQLNMTLVNLKKGSSKTMIMIIAVVFLLVAPLVLMRLAPSKSAKDKADNKK